MKHNKEQFEYPKSIVIPSCEGEYLPPITVEHPLRFADALMSTLIAWEI
ncbi:MAG: hypothetical protein ACM3X1_07440 [Ignavibacteriales bacterium]